MKVKNKILLIVVFFVSFIIISLLLLYSLYKDEVNLIGNNFKLLINSSSYKLLEEKNRNIDISSYDIDIELYPDEQKIFSDIKISGVLLEKGSKQIELDFYDNFQIHLLQLNGRETEFNFEEQKLIIKSEEVISDSFEVRVVYEGTPKNLGFGSFTFGREEDQHVVYTLNEPVFASTWFPCNDTPADKAMINISISNDSGMVSVSNGKLISIENKEEKVVYNWSTFYPISTYLIAIYSAPYQSFSQQYISSLNDTMSIDYYVLPEKYEDAQHAFSDHPNYISVFSKLFGEYPFIKEKYGVAQILWNQGAMESQTIVGIGTNFISGAKFFSDILIHETAHHWWGNSVTPKSWKDIWLNEGFATYSEALYWEATKGKQALISTMASFRVNDESETLYNPKSKIFSQMIYNKGAWVLHMLRKEIGDTLFFNSLRHYYQKYKYSNADTYDFKEVCEETSQMNLDKFFDQWLFIGKGKIEIEYEWEVKKMDKKNREISISISQTQDGYKCYNFPIDILIREVDGNENLFTYFITSIDTVLNVKIANDVSSVEFDPGSWLLASFSESE